MVSTATAADESPELKVMPMGSQSIRLWTPSEALSIPANPLHRALLRLESGLAMAKSCKPGATRPRSNLPK